MKTAKHSLLKYCQYACAALCALLLVLQFVPFWSVGGQGVSIAGYIWLPEQYPDLTAWLAGQINGYTVGSLIVAPIVLQVTALLSVGLFLVKRKESFVTGICSGLCALSGIFSAVNPALRLGSLWLLLLLAGVVLLAAAVGSVLHHIDEVRRS